MKAMLFAALAATALVVNAGEDSTERWGPRGTGPAYWETPCGLRGFASTETQAPCASPSRAAAQDMSSEEMRALMQEHVKRMDEMMSRMDAEHRSMMGGTGARESVGVGAAH